MLPKKKSTKDGSKLATTRKSNFFNKIRDPRRKSANQQRDFNSNFKCVSSSYVYVIYSRKRGNLGRSDIQLDNAMCMNNNIIRVQCMKSFLIVVRFRSAYQQITEKNWMSTVLSTRIALKTTQYVCVLHFLSESMKRVKKFCNWILNGWKGRVYEWKAWKKCCTRSKYWGKSWLGYQPLNLSAALSFTFSDRHQVCTFPYFIAKSKRAKEGLCWLVQATAKEISHLFW